MNTRAIVLGLSMAALHCGSSSSSKQRPGPRAGPQTSLAPAFSRQGEPNGTRVSETGGEVPHSPGQLVVSFRVSEDEDPLERAQAVLNERFWGETGWPTLPTDIARVSMTRPDLMAEVDRNGLTAEESSGPTGIAIRVNDQAPNTAIASIDLSSLDNRFGLWMQSIELPPSEDSAANFRDQLIPELHRLWFGAAVQTFYQQLAMHGLPIKPNSEEIESARLSIKRVTDGLLLENRYTDGIPTTVDGVPLRPLEIRVTWSNGRADPFPVKGVPLKITDASEWLEATKAITDGAGIASFDFADTAPNTDSPIGLELDADALAGSLAEYLPGFALSVPFRRITPNTARIAILVTEGWGEQQTAHLGRSLELGLSRGNEVVPVAEEWVGIIETGMPDAFAQLADSSRGGIDILITGQATSALSSRMGSRSVYHEAHATLTLHDVWSGREISVLEQSAQALGLGDARAAKNALTQLGRDLVEPVKLALKRPVAAAARP